MNYKAVEGSYSCEPSVLECIESGSHKCEPSL